MRYEFKAWDELLWMVGVSAAVAGLQVLVDFDPAQIADWKFWLVSLGAGMVRAAAGAAIAVLTRPREDG